MSKAARKRTQELRRSEKAKRRQANVAKYAAWTGTSSNIKKKGKTIRGKTTPGHPHLSFCGNVGCRKCFPSLNS